MQKTLKKYFIFISLTVSTGVLSCLIFILILSFSTATAASPDHAGTVTFTVKSSPDATLQTTLSVQSPAFIKEFSRDTFVKVQSELPATDRSVVVDVNGKKTQYAVDAQGNTYDQVNRQKLLLSSSMQEKIKRIVAALRTKHYGALLPWEEARKIIPRKAKFEIIDLETGLSFHVQRRAGSTHADVQPLTRKDTKIMKAIYKGKWSWKRRAILVHHKGHYIAASMHGMPHGRGSLRNGFPGHFCVHFYGSTTHRTKNVDPPHQAMVFKAAGKLDEYLGQVNPYELIEVFLMALNQHDPYLIEKLVSYERKEELEALLKKTDHIEWVSGSRRENRIDTTGLTILEIPVHIQIYWNNNGSEKQSMNIILKRDSLLGRWKVDLKSLEHL